MDNRRIYKKQSSNKRKQNLLGKVRNLVSSIWSTGSQESVVEETGASSTSSQVNNNTLPSTPANQSRITNIESNDELKTPNVLLSEFFQQKGDKPLTPVEYQGVMSLLSQSQKKPNNGVMSPLMPGSFTRFDSPTRSPSTITKNHTSLVKSTPSQKTPLKSVGIDAVKSAPGVFSTPEYKPLYPTISANNSIRKSGSVKRVYQFSGLPSPYKTKIKAPSNNTAKRYHTSLELTMEKSTKDCSKPSMTKAASTLLSVLDDKSKKNPDYLQQFSNPYMGKSIAKKSQTLTADVINSTIMFDQSTNFPDSASNNSSVTTPAADTASAANTETKTEPIVKPVLTTSKLADTKDSQPKVFGFGDSAVSTSEKSTSSETTNSNNGNNGISKPQSSLSSQPKFTFDPSVTHSHPEVPGKMAFGTATANTSNESSTKPIPASSSLFKPPSKDQDQPFSFGASASNSSASASSTVASKTPAFSFGGKSAAPSATPTAASATAPTTATPLTVDGTKSLESSEVNSFKFPTVAVKNANIDNSKVQLYKSLFSFSV